MTANTYYHRLATATSNHCDLSSICDFNIQNFPEDGYNKHYRSLERGRAILETEEQLNAYMSCYGEMHHAKVYRALDSLFKLERLNNQSVEVVDWGCGQALAACALIDYLKANKINLPISRFTLIEPSLKAVKRGVDHITAIYQRTPSAEIWPMNCKIDTVPLEILSNSHEVKIHLFSNILDMNLNYEMIKNNITNNFKGTNYLVCVSPFNGPKLQGFCESFQDATAIENTEMAFNKMIFRPSSMRKTIQSIRAVQYIYKINLK